MTTKHDLPFKSAPLWIGTLFMVVLVAFWPGYFGVLKEVTGIVHFHSLTAVLWMLLLIAQSHSIHRGWRQWHRRCGIASMFLFPLFLSSSLLIINNGNAAPTAFNQSTGGRLALFDLLSVVGFALFYFQALGRRQSITLHAGFMLATALFLIYPVAFRLLPRFVPMLSIAGPEDFENVAISVYVSSGATVAISTWVATRLGRDGLPFIQVALLIGFMAIGLATFTHSNWWFEFVATFGRLPNATVALLGLVVGVFLAVTGWRIGANENSRSRPE